MGQKQRVLDYIEQHGSISSMEAFRHLGVTRLSSVIFELKREGHEFDVEMMKSENEYKEKTRYARYSPRKDA